VKILLVEDSRTIQIENERALAQAGHEVMLAEEGETGLRLAREQAPDLILLDLRLPSISGIDVLRTLKGDPGTAQIPVVVVSGLSERNREMLMAEGAVDYLEKSQVMRNRGTNLLPELLEDVIRRIQGKRASQLLQGRPNRALGDSCGASLT
jgi:DNA-binding response OmpR family regulator